MYIDTHCHLTFEQYNADCAMVIGNAKKAGVKQMISVGVDPLSVKLAVELAQKNPEAVFASIGFHPYEASHNPDLYLLEQLLRINLQPTTNNQQPIVAIGECGLDYHLFKGEQALGKKQEQRILFEEQLRLAAKHDLPVIMHVRDAYEDFFTVIDAQPALPRGVIHCFSGGMQEVREAQRRKLYIGIDGNVTYSKQLALITPQIPLNMILLETDAPYLTPVPHRGSRNEPKYIPIIAEKVAELLDIPLARVAKTTTENARNIFTHMIVV
jgi:TatD DNase family protein